MYKIVKNKIAVVDRADRKAIIRAGGFNFILLILALALFIILAMPLSFFMLVLGAFIGYVIFTYLMLILEIRIKDDVVELVYPLWITTVKIKDIESTSLVKQPLFRYRLYVNIKLINGQTNADGMISLRDIGFPKTQEDVINWFYDAEEIFKPHLE